MTGEPAPCMRAKSTLKGVAIAGITRQQEYSSGKSKNLAEFATGRLNYPNQFVNRSCNRISHTQLGLGIFVYHKSRCQVY